MSTSSTIGTIRRCWQGGYTLGVSFWGFGVLGTFLLNVLFLAGQSAIAASPVLGLLLILVLSLSYQVIVGVGIWRSAGTYAGPRAYAVAARLVVAGYALYGLWMLVLSLQMLLLGAAVMVHPPFIK